MRKLILLTFTLIFYFSILYSQEKVTWDFPIKDGTDEWEKLTSYEEKLDAYNIPNEILCEINTSELVQICLKYPELRLIMTRNSLQQGYDYLNSIFNGFGELEKRSDAAKELLKEYKKLNPKNIKNIATSIERGAYAYKLIYIEILLAQKQILLNVDNKDKKELIKTSLNNYESIELMPENYGTFGLITPALILGRLLDVDNNSDLIEKKSKDDKLKAFIDYTFIGSISTLSDIIVISKEYLKELENE
jgi:hypothetical protein